MIATAIAVGVLSACALAAVHGARAALAARLYRMAKYGEARRDPLRVVRLCDRSIRLHPWSYAVCILAARTARDAAVEETDPDAPFLGPGAAFSWCERGLALNPYKVELRFLMADHLSLESADQGVAYWKEYVDWHFWSPSAHATLAQLLERAGRFDEALRELALVRQWPEYDPLRRRIETRKAEAATEGQSSESASGPGT